jgi:DNA-binding CsgD family transcriptional regulator
VSFSDHDAVSNRGDLMNESTDLLHCHFGLTPSEARLALNLVTGETLRSAAAELHISYETARTQLKSILSKTGTRRQAELVVVIVTAFPDFLRFFRFFGQRLA